ncbi:hypothetical protein B4090_3636 [Bacillus licheniformis]|nr:hypothetical protein B4090_3636 [Bacillus licheniformis]TWK96950.1 hypothetical protein CHCC20327_1519 [Bacillus licheniformis]TWM48261.1 hypothetical protein CHCC14816_2201 [Bacillus licheniformis]
MHCVTPEHPESSWHSPLKKFLIITAHFYEMKMNIQKGEIHLLKIAILIF